MDSEEGLMGARHDNATIIDYFHLITNGYDFSFLRCFTRHSAMRFCKAIFFYPVKFLSGLFVENRHFKGRSSSAHMDNFNLSNARGGIAMLAADAEHVTSLPRYPRYDLAKSKADQLTALYSTPPIPVLEIAENNGVNVVFADFGQHTETVAGFCDFNGARLYVNQADHTNRQTFTIAHELGHWMLHRDIFRNHPNEYPVLPRFQTVSTSNVLEKEANCFAANLLVPSRLLGPVRGNPVASLALVFAVSSAMMENRLKNV